MTSGFISVRRFEGLKLSLQGSTRGDVYQNTYYLHSQIECHGVNKTEN